MQKRIKLILEQMDKKGIDCLILFNSSDCRDYNVDYITGYNANGIAVLSKENILFFTSPLESGTLKGLVNARIVEFKKLNDIKIFLLNNKIKFNRIGVNKRSLSVGSYGAMKEIFKREIVDFSGRLGNIRVTKDNGEIDLMKKSAKIASEIIEEAIDKANSKITEDKLKIFIRERMLDYWVSESFETIVGSRKNAANPHHISRNVKLRGFTVIDMGVRYKDYCSDTTRTIYVGRPSEKEKEIYNTLLDVQEKSIDMINDNKLNAIYFYAKRELGDPFIHSLGHGIGLEVHEFPIINKSANFNIVKNSVITIEPGYYIKNKFGIRIEDMILFKNKPHVITSANKKLIIKK